MDISLTKKILIIIGLSLTIFAWAGKKISEIDQYQDVEIVDVSWRGISIVHRSGVCMLTESDLSPDAKKMLSSELAEYLRRKADHDDNMTKTREFHTQQVNSILSNADNENDSDKKLEILNQAVIYKQAENYKVVLTKIQKLQQEKKEAIEAEKKRVIAENYQKIKDAEQEEKDFIEDTLTIIEEHCRLVDLLPILGSQVEDKWLTQRRSSVVADTMRLRRTIESETESSRNVLLYVHRTSQDFKNGKISKKQLLKVLEKYMKVSDELISRLQKLEDLMKKELDQK